MAKFGIEIETLILDKPNDVKKPLLLPVQLDLPTTLEEHPYSKFVESDLTSLKGSIEKKVKSYVSNLPEGSELQKLRRRLIGLYFMIDPSDGLEQPSESAPSAASKSASASGSATSDDATSDKTPASRTTSTTSATSKQTGGGPRNKLPFAYFESYNGKILDCEANGEIKSTQHWVIDHDSSVMYDPNSKAMCYSHLHEKIKVDEKIKTGYGLVECIEIVSPPFDIEIANIGGDKEGEIKDKNSLKQVFDVIQQGNPLVFFNNDKTSQHIHMSFKEFSSPFNVLKACLAWWWFEPVIMSLVPHWRRANNYCTPLRDMTRRKCAVDNPVADAAMFSDPNMVLYYLARTAEPSGILDLFNEGTNKQAALDNIIAMFQGDSNGLVTRYTSLNLLNLKQDGIGTIEVRIKHGSTDVEELKSFVKLFHKLFTSAIEKNIDCFQILGFKILHQLYFADFYKNKLVFDEAVKQFKTFLGLTQPDDALSTFINNQIKVCNPIRIVEHMQVDVNPAVEHGGSRGSISSARRYHIFMYGSNNSKQVMERCNSRADIEPIGGYIDDHVRIFAGWSTRWRGGVASIHPKKGSRVYGSVYKLTKEQIEALDKFEGGYLRERRTVMVPSDDQVKSIKCYVYIKTNFEYTEPPSKPYLEAIKKMLHETTGRKHTHKIMIRGLVKNTRGHWSVKTMGYYDADGVTTLVMHDKN